MYTHRDIRMGDSLFTEVYLFIRESVYFKYCIALYYLTCVYIHTRISYLRIFLLGVYNYNLVSLNPNLA